METDMAPIGDLPDGTAVRNTVFASGADDARARRTVDGVVLVLSLLLAGLAACSHASSSDVDGRIAVFMEGSLPGWISAIATVSFIAGGLFAAGVFVAVWVSGRAAVGRDMLVAVVVSGALTIVGSFVAGPEWPDILPELLERDGRPSFPVVRLAIVIAVLRVALPYLSVPMRRISRRVVVPMGVAAVVLSYGTLSAVIGAYAVGVAAAAAVHLIFGSGVGVPSRARITDALRTVGLDVVAVDYFGEPERGVTSTRAELVGGDSALVKVYGRDSADSALAARVWRSVWYVDHETSFTASGLQQVEHEGLMLLEAQRAGVPVPRLVAWGRGRAGDAVIATEWAHGQRLVDLAGDDVTDQELQGAWHALVRLHDAGIAHRAIDRSRIVLAGEPGQPVQLDGLAASQISPEEYQRSTDVAQMLVTLAVAVGGDRAIASGREVVGDAGLGAALPLLQRSALPSSLQRDAKDRGLDFDEVRADVAAALGTEVPEPVQLARTTFGNIAMVVLTLVAANALITTLADIGLDRIADELADARWTWIIVALVLAQLTNIGEWISLSGMVNGPVPFGPTIMFRYAISFISLAVPSDAGAIAMNVRYMQRLGVAPAAALAQGPLLTVVAKLLEVLLLAVTANAISDSVDFGELDGGPVVRLLTLVGVVVVVGAAAIALVPKLRNLVVPPLREAMGAVRETIRDPERMAKVVSGALISRMLFAMTLAASVTAFGGSISFAEAVFVNSAVSLFVGLVPVPGGVGVGEAALTAGLVAVGIPESTAVAAALTHRVLTAYLPPVYGWYTTRWLNARDYL